MSHIALYRSWRPQMFKDMVGQQHIIQTLQNAIREQRVSHAYLFNGPRGTGKTTTAKVLAKAVNCEHGPSIEPCNQCDNCIGITEGHIMDVVEIDAASNRGIDEIRDIRDKVRYAPTEVRFKVYIIDEVHMLTAEAFNALLKTLEEPPPHVIFILATTEPHKLPATIISRCQRFDFRQVSTSEQVERLQEICEEEGIEATNEALAYIARLSEGGMRDAISLLEQTAAFADRNITLEAAVDVTGGIAAEQFYQLAEAIKERDVSKMLPLVEGLMQGGKSPDKCMENLIYYFRDLLVLKLAPQGNAATERIVDHERFIQMAESYSPESLFSMIETLNHYQQELRHAAQPQTLLEVALLKLCSTSQSSSGVQGGASAASSHEIVELRQHVQKLEGKLAQLMKQGIQATPAASNATDRTVTRKSFTSTGVNRPKIKLDQYVVAASSQETNQARMNWSDVLMRVKDRKVTVHAWLRDSELVSAVDQQLLLTFKNEIHRETTEKPTHRELIEQVSQEVLGKPYQLVTVMLKDWQNAMEGTSQSPTEALELEPEDISINETKQQPIWIEEAVKLFGEDLVVVTDK
ncbi:MAG: DNA polymerase III subunit gamma/tau [Candidatus Pristimantibacillus lignocellulolyticus]|uniref:DNA-directed DNA polymerase n=1 Tax=Candidatus Pristimantibacillus lignocellulolyticus TaxID=2994561 RepID=A0A9J6ZI96_9BACL|nr:MAG: DNA polymerase III subunit gamma/tau [Candidatus Pristimantibacillus lignocellulolyticus]